MTKSEYKAEMNALLVQLQATKQAMVNLENKYFDENAEFYAGDKVRLVFEENKKIEEAYVSSVGVFHSGEFSYNFRQTKKDGSLSNRKRYIWSFDGKYTVELLEKGEAHLEADQRKHNS